MSHLLSVPGGHVAAVVTYLQMDRPARLPRIPSSLQMEQRSLDLESYRQLFARVGAHWLWYSRLAMSDLELTQQIGEVHVVLRAAEAVGFVELDRRSAGETIIRFLGLVPEMAGQGHGAWLMGETVRRAWKPGVRRLRVHTCSLDHPAALPAYLRAGFRALERNFEHFPDPRLTGLLPRTAAPQIPLVPFES